MDNSLYSSQGISILGGAILMSSISLLVEKKDFLMTWISVNYGDNTQWCADYENLGSDRHVI